MLPVPFMFFLRPLPLPRLSSVNLFQRRSLSSSSSLSSLSSLSSSSSPGHYKGGTGPLLPQPNVYLLTPNCQQLPLSYQVRGPHLR